jgi:lysine-ketoglutarate reductase/saccharopine dehydrogenase-like protein (TIGR00300 family)
MSFKLPPYREPDFRLPQFAASPDAALRPVEKAGVAPEGFHATTIFPEYFKIAGAWTLLAQSRMDCTVVLRAGGGLEAVEFRRLQAGDLVVVGRSEDGRDGIYIHTKGFSAGEGQAETFAFRTGRSRETSYSRDYDRLYDLLRFEKDHGHIVWVLGPAVVFDSDSKKAMISLIENGYVHAILAGNALAAHDLEGAVLKTALGQDIYTQESVPDGHYHHLDIINRARACASLDRFLAGVDPAGSVICACAQHGVPVVLAGSIRDDGPLPGVIADVYAAQDAMRRHARQATTVLCLATQLHSIATGNMTPAYQVVDGVVRPVSIFSVDVSEFAVNKLRDRGTLAVTSIVTNIQDFLVNLHRNLVRA